MSSNGESKNPRWFFFEPNEHGQRELRAGSIGKPIVIGMVLALFGAALTCVGLGISDHFTVRDIPAALSELKKQNQEISEKAETVRVRLLDQERRAEDQAKEFVRRDEFRAAIDNLNRRLDELLRQERTREK